MIVVRIGGATRALHGDVSGDAFATFGWSRGPLVALVDGLGHGPIARIAADAFLACVRDNADESLDVVLVRAHHALMKTRGAVASLARFDEERGETEICGIGNVTVTIVRGGTRAVPVVLLPGILGTAYRKVRPQAMPFAANDLLVMHTDGIRSRVDMTSVRALEPSAAAEELLRVGSRPHDDAGVIVARATAAPIRSRITAPEETAAQASPHVVPIRIEGDAATCAVAAREFAGRMSLTPRAQWEVSIAASELATNVLKFGRGGTMTLTFEDESLVIEVVDVGRGIEELSAAIADGWSEGRAIGPEHPRTAGRGLGVGLGTVHRMMDRVEIETGPERGTRIVARKRR